ncbi:putative leucine-rich repeat receptor-like serine/threonine-protein kinase At2g24130 [Cryptomeria japonica]|uniref:putative leucine-rich repeat receptor-like serine/threonine-protein kinase At2g24130 n=1 Tax=Cryptomeria japonica TaxID=3369 RepID=UPI0027DA807D|nr:putative leucine-rich repeat receptor-like serine/threonine-protein kinase At2g24130 [Cryptomeria japonica]
MSPVVALRPTAAGIVRPAAAVIQPPLRPTVASPGVVVVCVANGASAEVFVCALVGDLGDSSPLASVARVPIDITEDDGHPATYDTDRVAHGLGPVAVTVCKPLAFRVFANTEKEIIHKSSVFESHDKKKKRSASLWKGVSSEHCFVKKKSFSQVVGWVPQVDGIAPLVASSISEVDLPQECVDACGGIPTGLKIVGSSSSMDDLPTSQIVAGSLSNSPISTLPSSLNAGSVLPGIVLSRPIQLNNVSDGQALLAFRAGITVDLYNSLSDWNSTHPVCNWSGVKCSTRRQRVVELNLTGMSLQGSISPFLANISFLRVLDLNNNALSGNIPPELGNLARLRNLRLSKNRLEGSVPSAFSNCRLLKTFSVFRNRLSGGSGSIPPELGMLSQLNMLRLRHNHLTGQIPASLSNCTPLQDLELHNNSLSGNIPWEFGAKLSQLQKLLLWGNRLTGRIPNSLSNCTQLNVIDLRVNKLDGTVPMEFSQLSNLERLFLGTNRLVSGSSNSLVILSALSNCSLLEQIHLGENELTGTLPPSIDLLPSKLSIFNLSYNYLDGQIPPQIANLSNLTLLDLQWNFFNGSIPSSLRRLTKLERLFLGKNSLQGNISTEIGDLPRLGLMSLYQNQLSGSIPPSLGHLQQLRVLYLHQNKLSGEIPPSLGDCRLLEVIDLSYNNLSGEIPPELAALPNLNFSIP